MIWGQLRELLEKTSFWKNKNLGALDLQNRNSSTLSYHAVIKCHSPRCLFSFCIPGQVSEFPERNSNCFNLRQVLISRPQSFCLREIKGIIIVLSPVVRGAEQGRSGREKLWAYQRIATIHFFSHYLVRAFYVSCLILNGKNIVMEKVEILSFVKFTFYPHRFFPRSIDDVLAST